MIRKIFERKIIETRNRKSYDERAVPNRAGYLHISTCLYSKLFFFILKKSNQKLSKSNKIYNHFAVLNVVPYLSMKVQMLAVLMESKIYMYKSQTKCFTGKFYDLIGLI